MTAHRRFGLLDWYNQRSLRIQLLLLVLPLIFGTLVLVVFFGQSLAADNHEVVLERLDAEATDLRQEIVAPFQTLSVDLAILSSQTSAVDYAQTRNAEALERLTHDLSLLMQSRPIYSQIRLVDLEGVDLARVGRSNEGQVEVLPLLAEVRDQAIFTQRDRLSLSGQVWGTEVSLQLGTNIPTLRLISPLSSVPMGADFAGYFVIDLNLAPVFQTLNQHNLEDGLVYLVDSSGYYLEHTEAPNLRFGRDTSRGGQLDEEQRQEILSGIPLKKLNITFNDDSYIATTKVIRPLADLWTSSDAENQPVWTLVVAEPKANILGQTQQLGLVFIALFLFLAFTSLLALWTRSGNIGQRLETIKQNFEQVRYGNLDVQVEETSQNEIGTLVDGFNQMTSHIKQLVGTLEGRVQERIRDLALVSEISGEIAGLHDLDLILNRTINRIVEQFDFYHAQVFLVDDVSEYAVLVASTGTAGERLLAKRHKLAVGSDSVIGRVVALGMTVIAGDTASNEVPWQPNIELPNTRAEMALPLKVETRVIGALDLQSLHPVTYTTNDIQIFQVLADQLAIAINNVRLIRQLQERVQEVHVLNQRLQDKVWTDYTAGQKSNEPLAYRYDLTTVEPIAEETAGNGKTHITTIEIAGNKIGQIETILPRPLDNEDQSLLDAVAARVALAIDNARLVQETQHALSETQRLYEMASVLSSAAELDAEGIYGLAVDQLTYEANLSQVAVLLAEPIPSYMASHLTVGHLWSRTAIPSKWVVGQKLDYLRRGLAAYFEAIGRRSVIFTEHMDTDYGQIFAEIMDVLQAKTLVVAPLITGVRWFGTLICGSNEIGAFNDSFVNFTQAVADQLTIAIDNQRLFTEVQDEARRALALAEAGQLISQIGMDLRNGVKRLFRAVSGPGEFDRWWFGLVSSNGYELQQIVGETPIGEFPEKFDLRFERNIFTETVQLRQFILVNEFDEEHPVLGQIPLESQRIFGKHLSVPVMVSGETLLGVLMVGRDPSQRDFDERDIQLATTVASQLGVATENQRLFERAERQRQNLATTLETMPAAVLLLSPKGEVLFFNQKATEILGIGISQGMFASNTNPLYKAATDDLFTEQDLAALLLARQDVLSSEDFYIKHPNKERVDLLFNAAFTYNEMKEVVSVILVLQEITELRELEGALQTSLSETTALYEASRSIASVTTMPDLIVALQSQLQTLAPDHIFVLIQEDQALSEAVIRVVSVWPDEVSYLSIDDLPLPQDLLLTESGLILENIHLLAGDEDAWVQQLAGAGFYSLATLPMKARGERILGWFTIAFNTERAFTSEERRFLTTIADQAGVALDVQRLVESTQNALRSVANLYRGSSRIVEAQGIQEAIDVIRDELMSFKPARIDLILQRSPENPEALYMPLNWTDDRSLQNVPCLPLDPETLLPQADFEVMTREEYYIQNMVDEPDNDLHHALKALDTPYQAVLSVPLRVGGRAVGRLALGFLKSKRFTPDDRQFVTMLADSTAYIVENDLLFQQTQDSLEETGVLYQASRAIANAETREDVVQAMIDYAASAVVDKVLLITLLGDSWEDPEAVIEVTATWGRGVFVDLKGLRFSREQLPIWEQMSSPEVTWCNDINADKSLSENAQLGYQTLDIASFVVVPLRSPNRPIGAIMLASSEVRIHQDREIRIYQSLADQAAVQLENKRLYEQAAVRARQLSASAEVSRAATSILNLDELFPRIVNLIRDTFGYDHAQVFMLDENRENAVLKAATGEAGRQMLEIRHSLPVGSRSVVGRATALGEWFMVSDTAEADITHRPNPYLPETRSELAVPLLVKGEVAGVLDMQSNQPSAFSVDDIQVLIALADQLAIAIDNAQLFAVSQQRASEMTFLFDITSKAAAANGLLEMLETVGTVICRQMRAQEVAIFLYSPDENLLKTQVVVVAKQTPQGTEYQFVEADIAIKMGQGLVGVVAEERRPLVIADVQKEPNYYPSLSTTRSGVYVPLAVGENLVGVLGIEGNRVGQYDEDDLRVVQTLSTSLTAIVQNVQLVDELQASNERLREIDKLKTNFLAAMSHELRTPLNSIIGFSRVILKGIDGPITEMQRQDIQTIHDSGKHLLGLVNDILDQAKIEAGKMELVKEYFDLEAVVNSALATAKGLTKDKPIQLFTEIQSGLPQAFGDEFRTRQVLVNLLSNASKFTHEGSITASAYSSVDSETGRRMITVSVSDTGIGIAKENLGKIFESFQQVDNSTTRAVEGTGLGLPLSKSLVVLQGGTMWVESELGIGSTFYITVPTEPPVVADEENEIEEVKDETLPKRPERRVILAVDDEVEMINLYRRYLQKEGWQVIGETDPAKTEEMVAAHQPQLILLDINMPNRNGWQVLEQLKTREEYSSIPVIVCSIDNDADRSVSLGAIKHLVKPFVETELLKAVKSGYSA